VQPRGAAANVDDEHAGKFRPDDVRIVHPHGRKEQTHLGQQGIVQVVEIQILVVYKDGRRRCDGDDETELERGGAEKTTGCEHSISWGRTASTSLQTAMLALFENNKLSRSTCPCYSRYVSYSCAG